ncbi:MAG TPA: hypothetical protein VI643_03525 [Planctomycetota bacterium]|nr:hypothetical protein [Planctomycetota bacterium]
MGRAKLLAFQAAFALSLLQASSASPPQDRLDSLLGRFFEADSDDAREALLAELKSFEKSDVMPAKLLELARRGPKSAGGRENKLDHKEFLGTYYLAGTKEGKKLPLFIGLHGGGGSASDSGAQAMSFGFPKGCLAVFPTALTRPAVTEWNREREAQYVLALIEELKRSYDIDTNRIYLSGLSMGGWGTFCIGSHHADVFAGLAPCAAGACEPSVDREKCTIFANLHNTPIRWYHGERDNNPPADHPSFGVRKAAKRLEELQQEHGGYVFEYKEVPGLGHAAPPDGFAPTFDWLLRQKRNPCPSKVVWEPHRRTGRHFFWLKVASPTPGTGIEAEIDRKKNSVAVKTRGIDTGWTVFLNDKLVDLNKPVSVTVNGKRKFSGRVARSLTATVETIAAKRDPEMVFTARIDF